VDLQSLRTDKIANAVADFGLGPKIESLARLSAMDETRAHMALLSLGRTYVRRCVSRNGKWTSGLHVFWWVGKKLGEDPAIKLEDIRVETALPLARQKDLAMWSIAMFRLLVISDIGFYARKVRDRVGSLASLAEDAALATQDLSFNRLIRWIRSEGLRRFDKALPQSRYQKLSQALHKDVSPDEVADQ
jgi:hypothetical protein